ncbi:MAG: hypothetical protein DWQ34_27330 [Planctomycetota bacterium]|nr:MAG: hypothetical protein DWQ34_27330 [Planctomycetota bacterium]REK26113.1 MAG: hypothetical protein DWQ41_10680 [Planctomycetota bacterium]REK33483.1 MAG: hypothetical protein DWQ45_14950 [Planctomycetota bacterium]
MPFTPGRPAHFFLSDGGKFAGKAARDGSRTFSEESPQETRKDEQGALLPKPNEGNAGRIRQPPIRE